MRSDRNSKDGEWRSAKDPKSGREYYYHTITKETTWNKPFELAGAEERAEMIRKKEETLNFFKEMENNIFRKLRPDKYASESKAEAKASYLDADEDYDLFDTDSRDNSIGGPGSYMLSPDRDSSLTKSYNLSRPRRTSITGIRLVRTISSIDDDLMEMMRYSKSHDAGGSIRNVGIDSPVVPLPRSVEEKLTPTSPSYVRQKSDKVIKRRNSTGTLYVDSTMSQQDNNATIKCVCAVIRAHMVEAEKDGIVPRPQYDTFKDKEYLREAVARAGSKDERDIDKELPSLKAMQDFFMTVFKKSQMESECIIIALIYCERLVKVTKGRFCIRHDNWRPVLFASMILASKVWDDLSMWNVDFSQVSVDFDLHRVNELELALLDALHYEVRVPAGEYAKYYFHLRSMIARLGFLDNKSISLMPLNIAGARKLQLATEAYEESKVSAPTRRRCVSIHGENRKYIQRMNTNGYDYFNEARMKVGLEHLIHEEHLHGDGGKSTSKAASKFRHHSDIMSDRKL